MNCTTVLLLSQAWQFDVNLCKVRGNMNAGILEHPICTLSSSHSKEKPLVLQSCSLSQSAGRAAEKTFCKFALSGGCGGRCHAESERVAKSWRVFRWGLQTGWINKVGPGCTIIVAIIRTYTYTERLSVCTRSLGMQPRVYHGSEHPSRLCAKAAEHHFSHHRMRCRRPFSPENAARVLFLCKRVQ